MTGYGETQILDKPWDVSRRLKELGLNLDGLVHVSRQARTASMKATDLHPANASGIFAYLEGVQKLREVFTVEDEWDIDRTDGVESIRNDQRHIRITYSNVDWACDNNHTPKFLSKRGAATERMSGEQTDVFEDTLLFGPIQTAVRPVLYCLLVDSDGRAELTNPEIVDGEIKHAFERIFLILEKEDETITPPMDEEDFARDREPDISRKRGASG